MMTRAMEGTGVPPPPPPASLARCKPPPATSTVREQPRRVKPPPPSRSPFDDQPRIKTPPPSRSPFCEPPRIKAPPTRRAVTDDGHHGDRGEHGVLGDDSGDRGDFGEPEMTTAAIAEVAVAAAILDRQRVEHGSQPCIVYIVCVHEQPMMPPYFTFARLARPEVRTRV